MNKITSVNFIYRTYSRTREGSQLEEIRDKLSRGFTSCSFSEGENVVWPVSPLQVDQLRDRGMLLTERDDIMCVIIQELSGTIQAHDYPDGVRIADNLLSTFPNTFAALSVETSYFTEVHAV